MAVNGNAPEKICLYPDQLASLISLARVLPERKYAVLLVLLRYLRGDSLTSTATREQIEELTGVRKRTIFTYLQEFEECGLIKQWRGPFETKQKFYRINLPVSDTVFEFYGKTAEPAVIPQAAGRKVSPAQPRSVGQKAMSVFQGPTETIVHAESSIVDEPRKGIVAQVPSADFSEDFPAPFLPNAPQTPPAAPSNPIESADLSSLQDLSQGARAELASDEDKGFGACAIDSPEHDDDASGPYFSDPRLDLLIDQIEKGRKHGTRVFRWFQSQNILTY
jgi:hypothetical protein